MQAFSFEHFSFSYPHSTALALEDINLNIPMGSFTLLCGASGSGKSTLLQQMKPILAAHGKTYGNIKFFEQPLTELSHADQAKRIGFVLQDIDSQIVTDKVWHELAFGLESLGMDTQAIRLRVAETAAFFGLQNLFHHNTAELSGGQKQLVNLAAIMVMKPDVLILDEPCSQLDPLAADNFLHTLRKINRELGTTIILSEQRLEDMWSLASQVVVLDQGHILTYGTPTETAKYLWQQKHPLALALPASFILKSSVSPDSEPIFTINQGHSWLKDYFLSHPIPNFTPTMRQISTEIILDAQEIWFRYPNTTQDILKSFSLSLAKGEFFALLGTNGVGKSTALAVIAGFYQQNRGKLQSQGRIALLPQNPQSIFAKNTVYEELSEVFPKNERTLSKNIAAIEKVIDLCQLAPFLERHPYDLSGGEKQRTALAKILLLKPDILLLDEPTKGLDAHFKQLLADILKNLCQNGTTILMASHDLSFCATHADRCALFFDGQIITTAEPHLFFSTTSYFTTPTNRLIGEYLPRVITIAEALQALDTPEFTPITPDALPPSTASLPPSPPPKQTSTRFKLNRTYLAALFILLLIPFTIYAGVHYWQDSEYYLVSMLILGECMLPFFLIFEGRHPKARELVIIAVFCALAVAGRALFFMLPQFKPVMAIVIIAGIALGGESGFLVGALTMLISNIFLGMGPWTPWQMFAMGLVGFLGGIIFHASCKHKKYPICFFGFFAALIIYGGIMNPASAIMSHQVLSIPVLVSYYTFGLPMDLVQGLSTFIFLWFLAEPILEKMERIKRKYGLLK